MAYSGFAVAHEAAPAMSPQDALAILREGNDRFVDGYRQAHGETSWLRKKLAREGQRPIAAVLACSDSREPVEYIFDQPLGGLFVIRTAGNTAGIQTLGSAQYAVEHLNVPLMIVMGHSHCGAVNAVVAGESATGALARMLEPIINAANESGGDAGAVTERNVRNAMTALPANDPILARRIEGDATRVLGAIYDIETGKVNWLK